MSKILFSEKDIKKLEKNINIKTVSNKAITYTDDFKNEFIMKSNKGIFPRQIFEEAKLDIEILGKHRIKEAASRWKKSYKTRGIVEDTRKLNSGRILNRELSSEEKIVRLEVKNKLLEAENELLKKANLIERGLIINLKD